MVGYSRIPRKWVSWSNILEFCAFPATMTIEFGFQRIRLFRPLRPESWQSENEIRKRLFFFHKPKINPTQAGNDADEKLVRRQEMETRRLRSAHVKSLEAEFFVGPRTAKFDKYCRCVILLLFTLFSVIFWLDSVAEVFCTEGVDEFGLTSKSCRSVFF